MADFKLPLSGNVSQNINPWNIFFDPVGSQFGVVNINMGNSSNPEIEAQVIANVASYGKQLGRICDAMGVLLKHFNPKEALTQEEKRSIRSLMRMLEEIEDVKQSHSEKSCELKENKKP